MKFLVLLALLSVGCATTSGDGSEIEMEFDQATEQHAWLQQWVGDWDVAMTGTMGDEVMELTGAETVRAFGDLWILAEHEMDFGGTNVTSLTTLGYDPAREEFVGSWIGSVHDELWIYRGQLDRDRKVLVLETKGPHFTIPGETARYRDTYEVLGPDRRRLTSTMEGTDGNWSTFMTAEYTRRATP